MLYILCIAEKMTSTTVQGSFTVTHCYIVLFIYVTFIYLTLSANTRTYLYDCAEFIRDNQSDPHSLL